MILSSSLILQDPPFHSLAGPEIKSGHQLETFVFPHGKPTARVPNRAPVAGKTEDQNVTEGIAEVGDNDDTMGADFDEDSGERWCAGSRT